jgi:hypothetical protein
MVEADVDEVDLSIRVGEAVDRTGCGCWVAFQLARY